MNELGRDESGEICNDDEEPESIEDIMKAFLAKKPKKKVISVAQFNSIVGRTLIKDEEE